MKKLKWLFISIVALTVLYFLGPKVDKPELTTTLPAITSDLTELESLISEKEDSISGLKPDNEGRIIWNDSLPHRKTKYAIVYLHGWSASYKEGDPIHKEIAAMYGCNLYLPRLYGHGIDKGKDNFSDLTADKLLTSAREALAVAAQLGDSVIIMGTSTGGTLALYLNNALPTVAGIILYSPNIKIADPSSVILDDPWGYQIAKLITGSEYYTWDAEPERKKYWTTEYRLKALSELEALVEGTMTSEVFRQVTVPTFVGCYYKDEENQDNTVSVEAIHKMFPQLGSTQKVLVNFTEVNHHVLGSSLTSNDLPAVRNETIKFLETEMNLSRSTHLQEDQEAIQHAETVSN